MISYLWTENVELNAITKERLIIRWNDSAGTNLLTLIHLYSRTLLLSGPERSSATHCWREDSLLSMLSIHPRQMFQRLSWRRSWLTCTRRRKIASLFSDSEPSTVEVNQPVSDWFTTVLPTLRSLSLITDWWELVLPTRLRSHLDNRESRRRTETRRSSVLREDMLLRRLRELRSKLFNVNFFIFLPCVSN